MYYHESADYVKSTCKDSSVLERCMASYNVTLQGRSSKVVLYRFYHLTLFEPKVISSQVKADQDVVAQAAKLNKSLEFASSVQRLRAVVSTIEPTLVKLFNQITECSLFIREYTRRSFGGQ